VIAVWLDVLVLAVLVGLLVGTILFDVGIRGRGLRALHTYGLLPQWSFFAPTPGTQNLYLLYRDVHEGGDVTAWRIVHGMDVDRGPWTFVWNPRRRLRKALHDLITGLPYSEYQSRPDLFKLSTPYLLIVHHLASLPRLRGAWATEFLIMQSWPHERPAVAFQSELHRL
jgi:hypothetical protein